jgi:hypothetical protein
MRRIDRRLILLGAYVAAALLLSLRVPMILPANDWRDVWLWDINSRRSPNGNANQAASVSLDASDVEVDSGSQPNSVRRWGLFARRQATLLFSVLAVYIVTFPLRGRLVAVGLWFDHSLEAGVLVLYLLFAASLLLEPPCIEVLTAHRYMREEQHVFTVYRPLWDRGEDRIDYGVLVTEQFALAALSGATYVGYCAFRKRRPWQR